VKDRNEGGREKEIPFEYRNPNGSTSAEVSFGIVTEDEDEV